MPSSSTFNIVEKSKFYFLTKLLKFFKAEGFLELKVDIQG